jgi:hypothetical protein
LFVLLFFFLDLGWAKLSQAGLSTINHPGVGYSVASQFCLGSPAGQDGMEYGPCGCGSDSGLSWFLCYCLSSFVEQLFHLTTPRGLGVDLAVFSGKSFLAGSEMHLRALTKSYIVEFYMGI